MQRTRRCRATRRSPCAWVHAYCCVGTRMLRAAPAGAAALVLLSPYEPQQSLCCNMRHMRGSHTAWRSPQPRTNQARLELSDGCRRSWQVHESHRDVSRCTRMRLCSPAGVRPKACLHPHGRQRGGADTHMQYMHAGFECTWWQLTVEFHHIVSGQRKGRKTAQGVLTAAMGGAPHKAKASI